MKTFVITGAGSGIGRATSVVLSASHDCKLILVGRTLSALEETKKSCENSERHIIACLDVRKADQWQHFLAQHQHEISEINGVFANAGIGGENHYGATDRWDEIISINLTGTYVTIMELLPLMQKQNSSFRHIVITSSCLARFGVVNYTAYCTAKTGLLGLTRSLAVQLAQDRILVNAICPGWVETEMAKAGIQNLADRNHQSYDEELSVQKSLVPLQRLSEPAEIGRLVKFLFAGEQVSMTGQAIDINNGSFMI